MPVAALKEERKAATPEEVWALLREVGEKQKENAEQIAELGKESREHRELMAKTNKELAELSKETREQLRQLTVKMAKTDEQIDKLTAKTDEQINKLNQHIGSLDQDIGALVEGMLTSNLFDKFHALGYDFDNAIANCTIREKETGSKRMLAELDMLMLNGTMALVIEVKTRMTIKDVDQHLNRMKLLHNHPNSLLGGRTLYGAMAGAKMTERSRSYAIKRGFFVLETSGDTVNIAMPEGKPAVW
ncbi:MAG: hypothetical protein LBJ41_08030 [Treponema sp.]|jgi:uncharacterized coiled-coil DUF342 family protein|nr:hypothetical protein [Treponema sp.]